MSKSLIIGLLVGMLIGIVLLLAVLLAIDLIWPYEYYEGIGPVASSWSEGPALR